MRIEDLCREDIIWEGRPDPKSALRSRIFSGWAIAAAICGFFDLLLLLDPSARAGGALAMFALLLIPVIIYPVRLVLGYTEAQKRRCCVTVRGIYVQDGSAGGERTVFRSYAELRSIRLIQHRDGTGSIRCAYGMENGPYQAAVVMDHLKTADDVYECIMQLRAGDLPAAEPVRRYKAPAAEKPVSVQQAVRQPDPAEAFFGTPAENAGDFLHPEAEEAGGGQNEGNLSAR